MQPYYRLYSVRSEFPRLVRPAELVRFLAQLLRVPHMYSTNLHSNRTSHRGHIYACQDKRVGMEEAVRTIMHYAVT